MIQLEQIKNFYPDSLKNNTIFQKYILKEYILLLILDYLSTTPFIRKITFIGGTSIRLTKGIDRFSEDLDFDCKDFSKDEFTKMMDGVIKYLGKNDMSAELKEKDATKLKAFRGNIHFPELLFKMGLSGYRDERFLIKIECQNQLVDYNPTVSNIKGCGLFFPITVPPQDVLCAMKVCAMLNRRKGRDFYDAMFLLSQTLPDFKFLSERCGISNLTDLKHAAKKIFEIVDLKSKMRDFDHLLFNKSNSSKILRAPEFFDSL
ncbi:MAG: nucleotidyl transferase AbiEii/AbiGii toxin family protein [Ignavibacterium sp.]|nr:nucleotidyl transferase AbiEii/AbiGii toxin family protein [Ignavibacterium sp.]